MRVLGGQRVLFRAFHSHGSIRLNPVWCRSTTEEGGLRKLPAPVAGIVFLKFPDGRARERERVTISRECIWSIVRYRTAAGNEGDFLRSRCCASPSHACLFFYTCDTRIRRRGAGKKERGGLSTPLSLSSLAFPEVESGKAGMGNAHTPHAHT